jgi:G3E family GTPase
LISEGILKADIVILNKIDAVSETEMAGVESRIRSIRHDAPIIRVSALTGKNMDQLNRYLEGLLLPAENEPKPSSDIEIMIDLHDETHDHDDDHDGHGQESLPGAVSYSEAFDLDFKPIIACDSFEKKVISALEVLLVNLKKNGCSMIGHIKLSVSSETSGYMTFSVTSFDHPPQKTGCLTGPVGQCRWTVNAIVFGMEEKLVGELVESSLAKFTN